MYLKTQIKEIENLFTSLKADVMIAEPKGPERQRRIAELTEQEKQAKESVESSYQELQVTLKRANSLAKSLKISLSEALQVLSYQELKQIHWHIDQRIPG